jgi:hypothetical protein
VVLREFQLYLYIYKKKKNKDGRRRYLGVRKRSGGGRGVSLCVSEESLFVRTRAGSGIRLCPKG